MTIGPFRPRLTTNGGVENPDDYHVGRGMLRYCELLTTGLPSEDGNGWVGFGNVNSFTVSSESNFLDHFSSMVGLRVRDKRIILDQTFNLEFNAEEFNEKNGALWFSSTPAAATNASIAGFTERQLVTNVVKGRWYPIVDGSGNRATGFNTADLLLEKQGSPDTALVEGVDYLLDVQAGLVFFYTVNPSTGASNVLADGDEVDATLTPNPNCEATRFIPIQNRTSVDVMMELVGIHAESDLRFILHLNKVSLSASGAMGLMTETELAGMPFTGACERVASLTYPVGWLMAVPSSAAT